MNIPTFPSPWLICGIQPQTFPQLQPNISVAKAAEANPRRKWLNMAVTRIRRSERKIRKANTKRQNERKERRAAVSASIDRLPQRPLDRHRPKRALERHRPTGPEAFSSPDEAPDLLIRPQYFP